VGSAVRRAYTAGLIDVLIEARDAWEGQKQQRATSEPEPLKWNISDCVLSGASAGSMSAAIAPIVLRHKIPLPAENATVLAAVLLQLKTKDSAWISDEGTMNPPIVPLMNSAATEEPLPTWPAKKYDPKTLRAPEQTRIDAVLDNVLRNSVQHGVFWRRAAKIGLRQVRNRGIDKTIGIEKGPIERSKARVSRVITQLLDVADNQTFSRSPPPCPFQIWIAYDCEACLTSF
jgi:hypothetical protein